MLEILSKDTFSNEVKLPNKLRKVFNNPILIPEKLTKFLQKAVVELFVPRAKAVKFGHENFISNIGDASEKIEPVSAYF